MIDLWEEATRVLPSHSWLTDFRLVETADKHEEQVAILGFSNAAPGSRRDHRWLAAVFRRCIDGSDRFRCYGGARTFRVASQSEDVGHVQRGGAMMKILHDAHL